MRYLSIYRIDSRHQQQLFTVLKTGSNTSRKISPTKKSNLRNRVFPQCTLVFNPFNSFSMNSDIPLCSTVEAQTFIITLSPAGLPSSSFCRSWGDGVQAPMILISLRESNRISRSAGMLQGSTSDRNTSCWERILALPREISVMDSEMPANEDVTPVLGTILGSARSNLFELIIDFCNSVRSEYFLLDPMPGTSVSSYFLSTTSYSFFCSSLTPYSYCSSLIPYSYCSSLTSLTSFSSLTSLTSFSSFILYFSSFSSFSFLSFYSFFTPSEAWPYFQIFPRFAVD